jgi:hypothetical protein
MALLLYPSKGPTKQKVPNKDTSKIYQIIGDEGMTIYKKIFDNNNKDLVRQFLNDRFIRRIWPNMIANLKKEKILPEYKLSNKSQENQQKLYSTMQEVTRILLVDFNLCLPEWWSDRYLVSLRLNGQACY